MRVIVAGSRTCYDLGVIADAIRASGFDVTHIISGGATGADTLVEQYAARHAIPITVEAANWQRHGKQAGIIRNEKMAGMAEALIAVWNGVSPGTKHMILCASQKGLRVYVHRF